MHSVETFRGLQSDATEWRRYLHENPELDYRLQNTARFVAEKLASFGINHIETGIAETGIVALIEGLDANGPTIGLRADMDALPMLEASNKPWSSKTPGNMHGCGHDGHTAMLLGAEMPCGYTQLQGLRCSNLPACRRRSAGRPKDGPR